MTLPMTYSRRKRQANPPASDVYVYDKFPARLRNQINQVLVEAIGEWNDNTYSDQPQNGIWEFVVKQMRRELGTVCLNLGFNGPDSPQDELFDWMRGTDEVDDYLDALEYLMRGIDRVVRDNAYKFSRFISQSPDSAIAEINARILEAGYGYQWANNEIVQVNSLLLHKEAVIPAIRLTSDPDFAAANAEYLKAHEAFRHADYETCLTECAKAFESVLKIIGAARSWAINENDPAAKLIEAAVKAGFLMSYVAAGFTSLRSMLESGVAPVRNKTAAHGAGTAKRVVPKELASFQLHQTASVIVFLIESHRAKS